MTKPELITLLNDYREEIEDLEQDMYYVKNYSTYVLIRQRIEQLKLATKTSKDMLARM